MALTLAEYLIEMNRLLPSIRRHPLKGLVPQSSRYDGHNCHVVVDCDCRELDHEDAPQALHAQTPEEE